jgi:flagellar biosynthesis protein FliR
MVDFDFNSYMVFLLITCRIAGLIFFNPIFGRSNIPNLVKVGLSLGIALSLVGRYADVPVVDYTLFELIYVMLKEFAVGFAVGFIVQMFMTVFHFGGELIDMQMGLSMAMMYDPTSNSQISINGNLMTIMFTLIFFVTNSHLALLGIVAQSFGVIPIGLTPIDSHIGIFFVELFAYILVYAVQLALPIVVTQIIVEVAVGIMMKVVPQVNVFVINLQLKVIIGTLVIITLIPELVKFMVNINTLMLTKTHEVLFYFT